MIGSGLVLVVGCVLVIASALDPRYAKTALPFYFGLFFWLGVALLFPSFAGGIGLLRRANWGRILIVIVSVEVLFVVPVGTALGIFGLWTLLGSGSKFVPAVQMPALAAAPAVVRQRYDILLAMAYVASGFLLFLGGGFLIWGGGGNEVSPGAMLTAGVLIGSAALLFQFRGRIRGSSQATPSSVFMTPTPAVKAAPTICEHLEPFESAMRVEGITVRPGYDGHLRALCRIHVPSLEGRFGPLLPVIYSEFFQPERAAEDNPTARLVCRQCGSYLDTLHPIECSLRTPWFPSGPAPPTLLAAPEPIARGHITAIAVSPSGRVAAVASGSHSDAPECVLWDTASRQVIRQFPLPGVMRALAWTPDEGALLTGRGLPWSGGPGSRGASVFLFDTATGVEIRRFGNELFGVHGMALSPDGSLALVSGMLGETRAAGSSLELWELASGRLAHQIARVEDSARVNLPYFTSVAFTPDGRLIVAGCVHFVFPTRVGKFEAEPPWWWNRCVRVWSAHDHQEFDLIRHHSRVVRLSVSSDSRRLFAAGDRLTVWSLANGKELWDRRSFIDHVAAASADGRLIARGVGHREDNHGPYVDTAVELYDGDNGEFVSLGLHRTMPTSLAFAQGVLVAGGEEGELRFWAF